MTRLILLVSLTVLLSSTASFARKGFQIAADLSPVIAAEEACGLSYKVEGIETFVADHVAEGDMSFNNALRTSVDYDRSQLKEMSPSELAAHCAQIRRVAKHYRFID